MVAIGLESFSFRTAIVESNHARGEAGWVTFIRHSKAPELPVVLLEDFAALLGLVFALIGVGLTLVTDDGIWDGIGTVAIGLLLVAVAVLLGIETKSLLLGEGANPEAVARIRAALEDDDLVERVIHMRTLHLGPEELLVAAKIAVPPGTSARRCGRGDQRRRAPGPRGRAGGPRDLPRAGHRPRGRRLRRRATESPVATSSG